MVTLVQVIQALFPNATFGLSGNVLISSDGINEQIKSWNPALGAQPTPEIIESARGIVGQIASAQAEISTRLELLKNSDAGLIRNHEDFLAQQLNYKTYTQEEATKLQQLAVDRMTERDVWRDEIQSFKASLSSLNAQLQALKQAA